MHATPSVHFSGAQIYILKSRGNAKGSVNIGNPLASLGLGKPSLYQKEYIVPIEEHRIHFKFVPNRDVSGVQYNPELPTLQNKAILARLCADNQTADSIANVVCAPRTGVPIVQLYNRDPEKFQKALLLMLKSFGTLPQNELKRVPDRIVPTGDQFVTIKGGEQLSLLGDLRPKVEAGQYYFKRVDNKSFYLAFPNVPNNLTYIP